MDTASQTTPQQQQNAAPPSPSHMVLKIKHANDLRRVTLSKRSMSKISQLFKAINNDPLLQYIPANYNELLT